MAKRKSISIVVILFALLVCAVVGVICFLKQQPPSEQRTQVNWTMYGTLIHNGGEIVEAVTFSIQGEIMDSPNGADMLAIYGTFPDTFRFDLPATDPAYISSHQEMMGTEYFVCDGYSFDREDKHATPCSFALSMQEEAIVIYWRNKDMYLVASTDPNANTTTVMHYFTEFVDSFANISPFITQKGHDICASMPADWIQTDMRLELYKSP